MKLGCSVFLQAAIAVVILQKPSFAWMPIAAISTRNKFLKRSYPVVAKSSTSPLTAFKNVNDENHDSINGDGHHDLRTTTPTTITHPKRVVVVGAGPAGLLTTIHLLRRNEECHAMGKPPRYHITVVDPGTDYGVLDEDGLSGHRSFMIGLSVHGISAIENIPGLKENYLEDCGIRLRSTTFGAGPYLRFDVQLTEEQTAKAGYMVDRNYFCSGLARYINENYLGQTPRKGTQRSTSNRVVDEKELTIHYNTTTLFVDPEDRCIMVRSNDPGATSSLPAGVVRPLGYDVVIGSDGIRSVVRNSILLHHREFEFSLENAFLTGKSIHINRPTSIPEGWFCIAADCLPNMNVLVFPERGGKINIAMSHAFHKPCDAQMKSNDPKIVADYMKEHFKLLEADWDEFGREWVSSPWGTTGQVRCNVYHSLKVNALLLGDAAHASIPIIGQGMNMALSDVKALDDLLNEYDDDWDQVLPAFSKARVKEGNALTEICYCTNALSRKMRFEMWIRQNVRRMLNSFLPWLVQEEPIQGITTGKPLSQAYQELNQLGYIHRFREKNNEIKREWFEHQVGLVQEDAQEEPSSKTTFVERSWLENGRMQTTIASLVVTVGGALLLTQNQWASMIVT